MGLSSLMAQSLSPQEFYKSIDSLEGIEILDVRTPVEFKSGHLYNALNIDWKDDNFKEMAALIPQSKPIYIYCLSGARSAAAAKELRSMGYSQVWEMKGGLLQWRKFDYPERKLETVEGMSMDMYTDSLKSKPYVLVDFYAEWCAPCKKMAPVLAEIALEKQDQLSLFKVDTDEHQSLCKELVVDVVPRLILYHKGKAVWQHDGYISREELLSQLTMIP
ncbi:thioredoxin domain-containing protein [Membranihabitans marinus]